MEFLHQRLGNISKRSLFSVNTATFRQNIDSRIDVDLFCTLCQISTMNKKDRSKIPLKSKTPFKWVFMDIIPGTCSKCLTKDTVFTKYLLIVDAYSKIPKLYGMKNITTEEVMDKLDMFQARFVKVDEFCWWDMERIKIDAGT